MTSAVAPVGLVFDSVDLQDLDGLFLEITQGLSDSPSSVRGVDVTVPGTDGQTSRPRRFHERRLVLSGFVRGSGATHSDRQADYRGNIRAMLDLFETGGGASYAPPDLVATLEDGSIATIAARATSVVSVEVVSGEYANVSVELLAVEEWAYETPGS